jgi:hexosaminidase
MKSHILALIFFILISFSVYGESPQMRQHNLMPTPSKIEFTGNQYWLDSTFVISVEPNNSRPLNEYATRVLRRLSGRTGLFFTQDFITEKTKSSSSGLILKFQREGKVKLGEVESYTLNIEKNKITIKAETDIGAFRGLETFLQLLEADENGYYFPTVEIEDSPRFSWRGLMIDVSRHFMPIEMLKRNIDGMAAVKMNVLHLHLSEDQGFRVECKSLPKLHELGSDGLYFTHEQIREIIKYANERGIRVMPEFDVPGHSTSWLTAYPELASLPGPYTIERNWGVFDPTFNPTIEETYIFFDKFFKEMSELFNDEFMHIGGDENNGKQWNQNPSIQKFMKENGIKDNHELQSYFNKRLLAILTKYNKKMIGWDEIFQPDMPNNIVIQSWRGQKSLVESAQKGYQAILSNGYYIDLIQSAEFHYLNDPIPADTPLSPEEQKFILGGEATMWAELVTNETVDSRIWPRTIAIAERFWSPGNVRDVDDMYRRMEGISFQMEELGLTHISNYEMMLRRLTNNQNIIPLKNLVDVVEPVKLYSRHRQGRKYTQQSPYTRVVDAARPESMTARKFNKLVDSFIASDDEQVRTELRFMLMSWVDNYDELLVIMKNTPIIQEMKQMSNNLRRLAETGLEVLDGKINGRIFTDEWKSQKLKLIEESKIPYGQTELALVPAFEKLINSVQVK